MTGYYVIFGPLNKCCDVIFVLHLTFEREVFDDWYRTREVFENISDRNSRDLNEVKIFSGDCTKKLYRLNYSGSQPLGCQ